MTNRINSTEPETLELSVIPEGKDWDTKYG